MEADSPGQKCPNITVNGIHVASVSTLLVSHEHRFIFVKTRKTGGSSVQIALSDHMDHPDDIIVPLVEHTKDGTRRLSDGEGMNTLIPKHRWRVKDWYWALRGLPREYQEHMLARFIRRHVGRRVWNSYYTFTIDRNPWDRMVSRYFFRFRPERGRNQVPFRDYILSDELRGQSNWPVYTHRDRIIVDHVIRYERLKEELEAVTNRLGLPPLDLPRAKGQYRTDRRPYQEWYTPETRQRVAEVFSKEIEYFGWTFE